ncbi:Glutamate/aspartate periplasmic-binding protein precursor [Delftia tsuruhatensis]|uniref:amino acid ABC transporter substrate-binding protein n=1 Tax=Delftia tsuruhatensis TaxID=180282 RepID=UPI001E717B2D|nr:amino acid ABC transporter substrate-binding protein [Delftia tsuruhatensis]CAB5699642.1 Glutamate/aspartate periplasmic-binding protein precursor [Delftia tsuruhatensis]CAC9693650.1 Glutamate/aspartate periplasmic-binding protein precursor [Delftia tsuruhatensis]
MILRQWGIALGLWALGSVSTAGVLEKVSAGGTLVIAHRESSIPFSYIDPRSGKPVGYALDLCLRLADAVRRQTGKKDMKVEFVMVTPANRMAMIEQGKADMECGSTTNNAQRRQSVAFTVPHFITGARLLVKAESTVNGMEDLKGKKLVSTKGTSPMAVATQANRQRLLGITIVEAPDHAKALEMVEKGEADAFLMDDVLLNGLAAARPHPRALKVVGKFLTTEPLAIMLPKADTAFKKLVDEEMKRIITSREIHPIYEKWFLQAIPPGAMNLNMPVSYLLRDFWKYPTADILL